MRSQTKKGQTDIFVQADSSSPSSFIPPPLPPGKQNKITESIMQVRSSSYAYFPPRKQQRSARHGSGHHQQVTLPWGAAPGLLAPDCMHSFTGGIQLLLPGELLWRCKESLSWSLAGEILAVPQSILGGAFHGHCTGGDLETGKVVMRDHGIRAALPARAVLPCD